MRRDELRADLAFMLSTNEGSANQDFSTPRLNKALDRAIQREVERAKLHANRDWFLATAPLTWAASQPTLELPAGLVGKTVVAFVDITDGEPGGRLGPGVDFAYRDNNTLVWLPNTTGPTTARTLRVFYEAVHVPMQADSDVPTIIPEQFHQLIVYSAACMLRSSLDDESPREWREERDELRLDYYKHTARPRPSAGAITILPSSGSGSDVGGTTGPVYEPWAAGDWTDVP